MADDISPDDLVAIRDAKRLLESPGLAARLSDMVGAPLEAALRRLPPPVRYSVEVASHRALAAAVHFAAASLGEAGAAKGPPENRFHKVAVTALGAGGGALGLLALPIELPAATVLMLRSIADIARAEGEDVARLDTRLACLEVFSLGGSTPADDAAESGYFAARAALAGAVTDARVHLLSKGLTEKSAPALVKLIARLAKRFGISVSQKVAAQAVPIAGAAGGAAINFLFMEHYQAVAKGHFTVRRLERKYSPESVRSAYELS